MRRGLQDRVEKAGRTQLPEPGIHTARPRPGEKRHPEAAISGEPGRGPQGRACPLSSGPVQQVWGQAL